MKTCIIIACKGLECYFFYLLVENRPVCTKETVLAPVEMAVVVNLEYSPFLSCNVENNFRFHLTVGFEVRIEAGLGPDAGEAGHRDGAEGGEVPARRPWHSSELLRVSSTWTKTLL